MRGDFGARPIFDFGARPIFINFYEYEEGGRQNFLSQIGKD